MSTLTHTPEQILVAETSFADCLPPGLTARLPDLYSNLYHANTPRQLLESANHSLDYLVALTSALGNCAHPAYDAFATTLAQLSNALMGYSTPRAQETISLYPYSPTTTDHGIILRPLREFTVWQEDETQLALQPVLPLPAAKPTFLSTVRATGDWEQARLLRVDPLMAYANGTSLIPHIIINGLATQLIRNPQQHRSILEAAWNTHANRNEPFSQTVIFPWVLASICTAAYS